MGGQIIDASIVPVPKQRNSGDDNARIKEGETPEGWENQPAKRSQKDTDARWTKKHGSHYGYKNHVNVDRRHKLVRRYQVIQGNRPAGKRGNPENRGVKPGRRPGDHTARQDSRQPRHFSRCPTI